MLLRARSRECRKRRRAWGLLLWGVVLGLLMGACAGPGTPSTPATSSATATVTPAPTATGTPLPTGTPSVASTAGELVAAPSFTGPTPTPVPLPRACLRQRFAEDLVNCGAIPSYQISLTVSLASARVVGEQEVRYTNQEPQALDELYLRLLPNAPGYGGQMTISNLRVAGLAVSSALTLENSAMRVDLHAPLPPGEAISLSMDFTVEVPRTVGAGHGLFSYRRGVMALPAVYPLIPVYDDEGWNVEIAPPYGDDLYADVAAYHVRITAPADQTLIVSGSCAPPQASGELATWSCEAAPMREFVLILGEYQHANRRVENVVVNSYYYPEHAAGGDKALQVAVDALTAFTERFGPYPYAELDVVETPNRLGGMEYPGLVVVEDTLYPGVAGVEWLTAHEVAHQWWFAVVGSDQVDEPWLDEALTQYSTMLYYEAVYGAQRAQGILNSEFLQTYQTLQNQGRDMPAGRPASAYGPSLYWQVVYDKGALYFNELRKAVGDEVFFEILRTYYNRHRYRIATPASFLRAVQDVSGDPHADLYETWIASPAPIE